MLAPEPCQVIRGRAREGIDGLSDVADDAHVVAPAQPQVEEASLEEVDVLELVDHEGTVLLAHDGGDVSALLEHAAQVDEDILKIDDAALVLGVLVHVEETGHVPRVQPGGHVAAQARHRSGIVCGIDHGHLRPLNLGRDVAHVRAVDGDPQAGGGGCDQGGLVRDDVGQRTADHRRPEVAQLAQGRGVEGTCLRPGHTQLGQSVTHLEGRALGKGHGQNIRRVDGADGRAVGDAVGDRTGLARAGAREDSEGPGDLGGDGALVGV